MLIHIKADMESEIAKAAIKLRNALIAAETTVGRGLWFLFCSVKGKRF